MSGTYSLSTDMYYDYGEEKQGDNILDSPEEIDQIPSNPADRTSLFLYLLQLLHIPFSHIINTLSRVIADLSNPPDGSEPQYEPIHQNRTSESPFSQLSDDDLQILQINKLSNTVTNDFHILRNKYLFEAAASHNQLNNSILLDDVSELPDFSTSSAVQSNEGNLFKSLLSKRLKEYTGLNENTNDSQYGTDFSLSRNYLSSSKYQDNYEPQRYFASAQNDDSNIDDTFANLGILDTSARKYHQSILNYYIPSQPISSAKYSILDSVISNYYIDRKTTLKHQKFHEQVQNDITKQRTQLLSKIVPLSSGQLSEVMNAWSVPHNNLLFNVFQIDVYPNDIKTLRDGRWLNDNVIDLYLNLVTTINPKSYAWTTHFFTTLQEKGYQGVARWAKRRKLNVFEKESILVPINIMNTHWALAVIDNVEKKIEYLDSLSSSGNINAIKTLSNYMDSESERLGVPKIQYQLFPNVKTPQQANGYDCGVFTCTAAKFVTEKSPLLYSQNDMKVIRRRMTYEILTKKILNN